VFKTGDNNDKGNDFYMPGWKGKNDEKLDLSLVMENSASFGF